MTGSAGRRLITPTSMSSASGADPPTSNEWINFRLRQAREAFNIINPVYEDASSSTVRDVWPHERPPFYPEVAKGDGPHDSPQKCCRRLVSEAEEVAANPGDEACATRTGRRRRGAMEEELRALVQKALWSLYAKARRR